MEYLAHLSADKKLQPVIGKHGPVELILQKNIPLRLIASVTSQQLSTKVADVIFGRFLSLYKTSSPKAGQILDTPVETLRSIGLSYQKAAYIHNIARFTAEHKITDTLLHKMSDAEIIQLLTQIKGVGQWTVEMLLMFSLGREDVMPVDDFGIQSAMCHLYKIDNGNKKEMKAKMIRRAEKWRPYRTYACRYLWLWKDE